MHGCGSTFTGTKIKKEAIGWKNRETSISPVMQLCVGTDQMDSFKFQLNSLSELYFFK